MDTFKKQQIVHRISTMNPNFMFVIEKKNENDFRIYLVRIKNNMNEEYEMIRYITSRESHRKAKKETSHLKNCFNEGYHSSY